MKKRKGGCVTDYYFDEQRGKWYRCHRAVGCPNLMEQWQRWLGGQRWTNLSARPVGTLTPKDEGDFFEALDF